MGHLHPVYDTDPHFHIDPASRAITHTTPEKLILIQGDHNSQVYTFDIPRYVDGHDMMLCNLVQVHYINTDGTNSMNRSTGFYEVLDMQVSPEDETVCVGSWLISQEATRFIGRLSFALRFACMNGTKLTYNWNSAVYDGVAVSTGYDYSDTMTDDYNDILEQWYWELLNAGVTGVNVVDEAKEKAIDEIESVLYSRGGITISETQPEDDRILFWIKPSDPVGTIRIHNLETGDFETITLDTLKGEKGEKGDPGNPLDVITQEFGNDENKVISQEAVTIKFDEIHRYIEGNEPFLADIRSDVDCLEQDVYSLLIGAVLDVDSDTSESKVIRAIRNWQSEVDSRCGSEFSTFVGDLVDKLQYTHTSGELGVISYLDSFIHGIDSRVTDLESSSNDVDELTNDVRILQSLTNFDTSKYTELRDDLIGRISAVEEKNTAQDTDIETALSNISRIDGDINTLGRDIGEYIDTFEDDIKSLRETAVSHTNLLNAHGGRLTALEERIAALEERIAALEAKHS